MEAFRSVSGAAAALMTDDINTDQVIPSVYLKDLHADMAQGLLAFMRRNPDGSSRPDFVLEKPQYRGAPILVTGANFGCGSSREHAVWALRAFGFRCVIGVSPAEFFRDNCLKNGLLPVTLPREVCEQLMQDTELGSNARVTVDLERQVVVRANGEEIPFQVDEGRRKALLNGLDEMAETPPAE